MTQILCMNIIHSLSEPKSCQFEDDALLAVHDDVEDRTDGNLLVEHILVIDDQQSVMALDHLTEMKLDSSNFIAIVGFNYALHRSSLITYRIDQQ